MLQEYKPLKARRSLRDSYAEKIRNGECEYKLLRAKRSLRDSYAQKIRSGEKKTYKAKVKSGVNKKYVASIFTNNLNRCYVTGTNNDVHIHHVFGAANKVHSEEYGFMLPLCAEYHNMSDKGIHFDKEFDLRMKRECQEYWLNNISSKDEFIKVFGKWW